MLDIIGHSEIRPRQVRKSIGNKESNEFDVEDKSVNERANYLKIFVKTVCFLSIDIPLTLL